MKRFVPTLFLVTLIVILFWPIISHQQILYCCDNLLINIPAKQFLVENVTRGIIPLWNPYIGGGSPYLADINLGTLYPFNAIYCFLEPFYALNLLVVLHIVIATIGMYAFARSLKLTQLSSVIISISFGLSGTVMTYVNNTPMLFVASWLPWASFFWSQMTKRFSYIKLVGLVSILVVQIFAGHPQLVFYCWLLYLLLVLFQESENHSALARVDEAFTINARSAHKADQKTASVSSSDFLYETHERMKSLKIFFGTGMLVFFLASIQLIPFIEFASYSTRLGRGYEFASFGSFNPLYLVRFLVPGIFGNPGNGTVWAAGGSVYGYIGSLAVIFMIFITRWTRRTKLYITISLLTLFLSFGKFTPVFAITYRLVPGIGLFRVPSHFLLLYTFAMSTLVGMTCDDLIKHGISKTVRRIIALGIVALFLASLLSRLGSSTAWHFLSSFPKIYNKMQGIGGIDGFEYIVRYVSSHAIFLSFILAVLAVLFLFKKHKLAVSLIGCTVFFELVMFGFFPLSTISPNTIIQWQENQRQFVAKELYPIAHSRGLVYVDPSLFPNPIPVTKGIDRMPTEIFWQYESLRPNMLEYYRIPTLNVYSSMIVGSLGSYLSGGKQTDPTGIEIYRFRDEKLKRTGVTTVITKSDDTTYDMSTYMLLYRDSYRAIYKGSDIDNTNPDRTNIQTTISPNSWSMSVYVDTSTIVPTTHVYYPGWNIYVDGVKTAIVVDQGTFISIPIPAGSHEIIARFEPTSVTIGFVLTMIGLLFLIILGVVSMEKQLKTIWLSLSIWIHIAIFASALGMLTLLIHRPALSFTFWKDDWIVYFGALTHNSKFWSYWYHPGTTLEFALFTKLFGDHVLYWQMFGVFLRFAASIGIGFFLILLTGSTMVGLIASALFAATPIGLDSVGWVSGHVPLLALVTIMCGLSTFIYGLQNKQKLLKVIGLGLLAIGIFFDPWRAFPVVGFFFWFVYREYPKFKSIVSAYKHWVIGSVVLLFVTFITWQHERISEMLIVRFILENQFDFPAYITKAKSLGNFVASVINMTAGVLVPIIEHASTGEYSRLIGRIGTCIMFGIGYLILRYKNNRSRMFFLVKFFLLWIVIFYIPHWLSEPRLTLGVTHRYMVISSVGVIALISLGLSRISNAYFRSTLFVIIFLIQIALTGVYYHQWQPFRSRAVTDTVWKTILDRSDRNNNAFYIIQGDNPVVVDSIHYSGFAMPIWYTRQTDSTQFPVVTDDYPLVVSYLCGQKALPNIIDGTAILPKTYTLSSVYGYTIGKSRGVIDITADVRQKLTSIAKNQNCILR